MTVTLHPAGGGTPTIETYTLNPHTRTSVTISTVLPNQALTMLVQSTSNIVAERVEYFDYNSSDTGATAVVGYQS